MKISKFALCATLLTTAVAVRATAATALAEASSSVVSVDTTFTEGSTVTGAMQIKYGKVGGASGIRQAAFTGGGVRAGNRIRGWNWRQNWTAGSVHYPFIASCPQIFTMRISWKGIDYVKKIRQA